MIDNNPWLLLDEYYSMFDVLRLREVFNVLKSHRETYWSCTEGPKFQYLDSLKKNSNYWNSIDRNKLKNIILDSEHNKETDILLVGQENNPLYSRYNFLGDQYTIKEVVEEKTYLQKIGDNVLRTLNLHDLDYDVNYIWFSPNASISWHTDHETTVPDRLMPENTSKSVTPCVIAVNLNLENDARASTEFKYKDHYYKLSHYKVALLNTSVLHCVDATPNERLTLRICLYGKPFEEIKEKLINEKTR